LNKVSITQNFCENKGKPKMHCNGKCHLKKQLDKADKQSLPGSSKEKSEIQFHFLAAVSELTITSTAITPHFTYSFSYSDAPPLSIFHPPTS
jgi:hypothetical protein